jgi:hypothetical protein
MAVRRNRILSMLLVLAALLGASQMVQGQTGMTGGGTGTGGTGGGTGTGGTGGTGTGGTGGTGSGLGTGGGTTGEFLGTGIDNKFIEGGYEPGALGHAGKAGNRGPTANTTLFGRFYVNALGLGLPQGTGATATVAFGTPLYSSLYTGTGTGTTGATGSVGTGRLSGGATTGLGGGVGGITAGFTPMNTNANTYRRPASYTTSIAFKYRPTPQAEVHSNLRQMLARSSDLAGNDSLEVLLDGQTFVLRGTVAEYQQSRLAENLLRMSPGVRNVRNEIQVQETAPPPKPLNP